MIHSVTLLLLMALSFGLLLFTVGAGKPVNASEPTEDSPSSPHSLDNHLSSGFKAVRPDIPSAQLR